MPLSKYHIRNEYGLADPELYRSADRDDPEALLEAVAMAGLIGLLRQLGDLAEFAAEIFHDLHEEVMATAARGHGLMTRVQQLEAEVPSLEKAFYSQTHHSSFFTNGGVDWHPNLRSEQSLVTHGDLPRFIMDSYEECRGPPRLFLLDKFDVAGAGACLKRYTDPSSFKMESASYGTATAEVHREKRIRKVKKKGARLRDGEGPNVVPTHAKLHQLLLEERVENGYTDPARLVKLKKRQLNGSVVEASAGKSYMEKFLETPSPDHKIIYETSIIPLPVKLTSDDTTEAGIKTLEISCISPVKKKLGNENTCSSPHEQESELKRFSEMDAQANGQFVKVKEQILAGVTYEISSNHPSLPEETELTVDEQKKVERILDGYHSDDVTSEVDNYMDALASMESELETDNECKPKKGFLNIQKVKDKVGKEEHPLEARFSYSQSFGDSSMSDEISSFKHDRNEEHIEEQAQLSESHSTGISSNSSFRRDGDEHVEMQAHFSDSQSIGNSSTSEDNSSFKKDRSYFHHSDSLSSMVDNIHSEPILFTNTECYEPENEHTLPNQLPQIVVHDDAHVHEEEISDSGQASYDLVTSGHVLCSDLGRASPVILPPGTQSDETPSDRTGLGESIVSVSVSFSLGKDDSCPVDSSDKNSLDNFGDSDPYVHSDDVVQVSNNLELAVAHENVCSDYSEIEKLQAESPNKDSSEVSAGRDMGSLGEDQISPSMEELNLNSGPMPVLHCQDSKDEDCIIATQLSSEDLAPIVEIRPVSCPTGELSSDLTHNNLQDEPGSAKNEVVCSDVQSDFEERPKMVHSDEIRSTCSVDPVEGDAHFKHLSSPENHVMVNDVVSENVQSEDQAVFTVPSVNSAEKDAGSVSCLATSGSLSNLHEHLSVSSDSCQMEMESNEVELTQDSMDFNVDKSDNQPEPSLDISSFDIMFSPLITSTKMEESLSNVAYPHEKEMEVKRAVAKGSLMELEEPKIVDQPETASADVQLNLNKLAHCDLSDSEGCNSSPRENIQHNASAVDVKMLQEFSGLDSQQSESIFDGPNDPLQKDTDGFSSPPCNHLESESDFEPFSQSQVGERDAEFLLKGEENLASEKTQQMHSHQLEQVSTFSTSEFASEIHADEQSSSHSLPHPSGQEVNPTEHVMDPLKPLLPNHLPKAGENNLDEIPPMPPLPPMQWRKGRVQHASLVSQREVSQASVQPTMPITPDNKSQFGLLTSERETLLYQSPFVPVMAVKSDKLQHSSGFSVGVSGHPVAIPFQFPIMVNEAKGQYNYLVLDRSQIQNPFLTLPIATTGRPPHGYIVASEGEMALNSHLSPPVPPAECAVFINDTISVQEKLTQPPSQLMTETSSEVQTPEQSISNMVSTGKSPDGHTGASEEEMVQDSNSCQSIPRVECAVSGHDSISPQEEPTQPLSQLMTGTNSEDKTPQQSASNVVSTGRPSDDHFVASDGEMMQSSNPCPPSLSAECAVSGNDSLSPQEEPAHTPRELMTEDRSEVKTPQSISNVEGIQGHPSISLMLPPNMESMEPKPSFLPSEEETALSLDSSAQTSDFDSERTNEKPKKLPRPRNPLIDAVAAHDKSKLRKVTERVMPQTAPKVDERDSLLEQIRTKSFSLKPAVTARPSIQGPKTNLKLAAILEKANAIRQALAGSDEDEDADSWSDS